MENGKPFKNKILNQIFLPKIIQEVENIEF